MVGLHWLRNIPLRKKRGLSLGFIQDGLIHSLAATKMIFDHRFHANPLRGNKERAVISQICEWAGERGVSLLGFNNWAKLAFHSYE